MTNDERPVSYWPESEALREMRQLAEASLAQAKLLHAYRESLPERPVRIPFD